MKNWSEDKKQEWSPAILLVILAFIFCVTQLSCRATKGERAENFTSAESVTFQKELSAKGSKLDSNLALFRRDSNSLLTQEDVYQEETVIEDFITGDSAAQLWENGHFVRRTTTKKSGSKKQLRTNHSSTDSSRQLHKADTGNQSIVAGTHQQKQVIETSSKKRTSGIHWSVYLVCLLIAGIVYLILYLRKRAKKLAAIVGIAD